MLAVSGGAFGQDRAPQTPATKSVGAAAPSAEAGVPRGRAIKRELTSLRTTYTRTYLLSDGRRLTKAFLVPANYRDRDGSWRAIDTSLQRTSGNDLAVAAADFGARLPNAVGSGEPVRLEEDGRWIEISLNDAAVSSAKTEGAEATYSEVRPGVDLQYRAVGNGLKELIVLKDAAAATRHDFTLRLSEGLVPRKAKGGAIDILEGDQVRFTVPAPYMRDADGEQSNSVEYDLERHRDGWKLTVEASEAWIRAKDRAFPVKVDPGAYLTAQRDCFLDSDVPITGYCSSDQMQVGYNGSHDHRALLRFDLGSTIPKGSRIEDSYLAMHLNGRTTTSNKELGLYRVTSDWTDAATWTSRNGTNAWSSAGGDFDSTRNWRKKHLGASWDPTGQYYYWSITNLLQAWQDGDHPNLGLMVKDKFDGQTNNMLSFASSEASDPDTHPFLGITWDVRPGRERQFPLEKQSLNDRMDMAVNVANGNLNVGANDLNIAGTGMPLAVSRAYNSLGDEEATRLGPDWQLSGGMGTRLKALGGYDQMLYGPTGSRHIFQAKESGGYTSPTGLDATLAEDGSGHKLTYHKSDITLSFNADGDLTKQRDRNGMEILYSYSTAGKLSKITDTQGREVTASYNGGGDLSSLADPTGRTWTYGYNGSGQMSSYTDPENKTTSYRYSGSGLQEIEDPRGNVTRFSYDGDGRVEHVDRGYNSSNGTKVARTTFAYSTSTAGCPTGAIGKTVVTDPRSKNTTYCYDKELRARQVTDARGNVQGSTYTSNSDVLTATSQSKTTQFGYNGDFMPNSVTRPAGEQTTATYKTGADKYRLDTVTNPQGTGNQFAWTSFGNMASVTDSQSPSQVQAKLEYNGQTETGVCPNNSSTKPGTLRCAIDGNSRQTRYGYDNAGNLTKITPPATTGPGTAILGETTITNDSLSRVKTVTDGKGQVKTFTYDKLDRTKKIEYSNGTSIAYTYDENGNQTERNDSVHGITSYAYDKLNRRTGDTFPSSVTNAYGYDGAGNLTSVTDAGGTVTYGYDDANNNTSLTEPGSLTTSFTFDDRDNRTKKTLPNGVEETTTYDDSDKPTVIEAKKGASTLTKFSYDYELPASPTPKKTERRRSVLDKDGNLTTYGYDGADRLTSATMTNGSTTVDTRSWKYDNASNRTEQTINGAVTSYAYNEANQLCWTKNAASTAGCGAPPSGSVPYRYDANGNETQGTAGRTATYNIRDQLASITSSGTTTNFGYAGPNQTERTSNGGAALRNNVLGLSGQSTNYWTRDSGGGLLSQRNSGKSYYLTDGLGSVRALTDSAGAVTDTYKTDPFGVSTASTGSTWNPWSFAGEYREPATGANIYKIGARNYDPSLGRWTQQDPLDQPDDLQNANRYVYAAANPVNLTDPTGTAVIAPLLYAAGARAAPYVASGVIGYSARQYARRHSGKQLVSRHNRMGNIVSGRTAEGVRKVTKFAEDVVDKF